MIVLLARERVLIGRYHIPCAALLASLVLSLPIHLILVPPLSTSEIWDPWYHTPSQHALLPTPVRPPTDLLVALLPSQP